MLALPRSRRILVSGKAIAIVLLGIKLFAKYVASRVLLLRQHEIASSLCSSQ
jgi:hypothetical protein